MFYNDGFLHAIVDTGSSADENETYSNTEREGESRPEAHHEPVHDNGEAGAANSRRSTDSADDTSKEKPLTRKQRQKAKRKLKKQQAKDLKKRKKQTEDNLTKDKTSSPQKHADEMKAMPPLRLHQFVSTVFRSELNVAENGAGYFVKNAPKVSAHHAILQCVVRLNGKVCKLGRTILRYGDDVSLQLDSESDRREGELMAWRGSEEVAKTLEGNTCNRRGERQGRMMASLQTDAQVPTEQRTKTSDCEMIKYYRKKLEKVWIPEVHELAMMRPLPLTLRVLKPSEHLAEELRDLGFRPVTEEDDLSLKLSRMGDSNENSRLSASAMQELQRDTWVARGNNNLKDDDDDSGEKRLGIFLSEARVTGEIMQQELTSMLPVAILASHLKNQMSLSNKKTNLRFLDLCAAPGSKTCQLLSALDRITSTNNNDNSPQRVDYTVVANELSPQRANWMRQRLHQQSCSKSLSNLVVTCADGRDYAKMERGSFDYILCDVPCSGDGTVRKSPKILGKWSPKNAEANKPLQKQLLTVGLGLLKPFNIESSSGGSGSNSINYGGFLVYSTCSLNPLENEEVISEVMDELNGIEENAFQYELVDLSEEPSSPIGSGDNKQRNNFLRVLPAKSHGGFFVAGIRKIGRDDSRVEEVVQQCSDQRGDVAIRNSKQEIVRQYVGTSNETTISYSISQCTRRCHADLIGMLDKSAILSSGVAALYESNDNGQNILQQGCASLASSHQQELDVAYIRLSPAELVESHAKFPAHCEVTLPMDRVQTTKKLDSGMSLIVEVGGMLLACGSCQSFLLSARIVQIVKDGDASSAGSKASILAKILARPQILKRALLLP